MAFLCKAQQLYYGAYLYDIADIDKCTCQKLENIFCQFEPYFVIKDTIYYDAVEAIKVGDKLGQSPIYYLDKELQKANPMDTLLRKLDFDSFFWDGGDYIYFLNLFNKGLSIKLNRHDLTKYSYLPEPLLYKEYKDQTQYDTIRSYAKLSNTALIQGKFIKVENITRKIMAFDTSDISKYSVYKDLYDYPNITGNLDINSTFPLMCDSLVFVATLGKLNISSDKYGKQVFMDPTTLKYTPINCDFKKAENVWFSCAFLFNTWNYKKADQCYIRLDLDADNSSSNGQDTTSYIRSLTCNANTASPIVDDDIRINSNMGRIAKVTISLTNALDAEEELIAYDSSRFRITMTSKTSIEAVPMDIFDYAALTAFLKSIKYVNKAVKPLRGQRDIIIEISLTSGQKSIASCHIVIGEKLAQAGNDKNITLCNTSQKIDLMALLDSDVKKNGVFYLENAILEKGVFDPSTAQSADISYVINANNCSDTAQIKIQIIKPADYTIEKVYRFFQEGIQLPIEIQGPFTAINISPPINLSCYDCTTPVILSDKNIQYTITFKTPGDCTVEKEAYVRFKEFTLYLPNILSRSSKDNHTFFLQGDEKIYYDLAIYDTWGSNIFYESDLLMGYPDNSFDAKYTTLTSGTYLYVLNIRNLTKPIVGTFTLIE
jgi:hypothetical protein